MPSRSHPLARRATLPLSLVVLLAFASLAAAQDADGGEPLAQGGGVDGQAADLNVKAPESSPPPPPPPPSSPPPAAPKQSAGARKAETGSASSSKATKTRSAACEFDVLLKEPVAVSLEVTGLFIAMSLALRSATTMIALIFQPGRIGLIKPLLSLFSLFFPSHSTAPHYQASDDMGQPHTFSEGLAAHSQKWQRHAENVLAPIERMCGIRLNRLAAAVADLEAGRFNKHLESPADPSIHRLVQKSLPKGKHAMQAEMRSATFHSFLRPALAPAKLYASWKLALRLRDSQNEGGKRR